MFWERNSFPIFQNQNVGPKKTNFHSDLCLEFEEIEKYRIVETNDIIRIKSRS